MKTVLIAGVPYSDNYGDNLIHMGLKENLLSNGFCVDTLDIGGRTGFQQKSKKQGLKTKILNSRNKFLIRFATFINIFLVLFQSRKRWSLQVKASDMICIGGGNLISDVHLNFPLKIFFLHILCVIHKKKYAFVSVGVAEKHSRSSSFLFKHMLESKSCIYISVRDVSSKNRIKKLSSREARVTLDPAMFLKKNAQVIDVDKVAINIVDPIAIMEHSDKDLFVSSDVYNTWVCDLINRVKGYNLSPVLYTNGAKEDNAYLMKNFGLLDVDLVEVDSVAALMSIISSSNIIVATRLHSAILASVCEVPFTGMLWDSKVDAFFEELSIDSKFTSIFSSEGLSDYDFSVILDAQKEFVRDLKAQKESKINLLNIEYQELYKLINEDGK
tara:strand:+ start:11107 stop:12261 length:1155 start_codon:yes stop_codon:yes gene_type:complete